MVLIIPLGGLGSRFVREGYARPKPLIEVEGKPIIAHVLDLFPGEDKVIFVCRDSHLETTHMREQLLKIRPNATIVPMKGHKLGPVPGVEAAYDFIDDNEEVLISYCDYTGKWDYEDFKRKISSGHYDGAIAAYKGFHPHLLGPGYYGHMRWDENNLMLALKEKESFTDNKMDEYGAIGAYWFRTGALMKKYFAEAREKEYTTNNEYHCSVPFNYAVRDGLKVLVYEVEHFCQWGTPADLEEYEAWSRAFAQLSGRPQDKRHTEIPPQREHCVRIRPGKPEDLARTFDYWRTYFSSVDWHPYKD